MKKYFLIIILIISTYGFSQNNKLLFKVGAEYRITPISNVPNFVTTELQVFYNKDTQLTGTAFNYSLAYVFKNGFGFGIQQSFRYGHIYFETKPLLNLNQEGIGKSVNGLITDFKIFIIKYYQLNDYKSFFVELGGSLMNSGTAYSVVRELGTDFNNNPIFSTSNADFNFSALNMTLGFAYRKFDIGLGAYFVDGTGANFDTEDNIILPYLKLNYIFGKKQ